MALRFGLPALRIAVNTGCSLGSSGYETNLGPSMTIGTGFSGGSSLGDNLTPHHLLHYARIAYNKEASESFGNFTGLDPLNLPKREARPWRSPSTIRRRRSCGRNFGASSSKNSKRSSGGLNRHGNAPLIYLHRPAATADDVLSRRWIRGSLPRTNMAAQIIEVAPGLDIEALTDVALKTAEVQAGILVVERQFGYLEIHSRDMAAVKASAEAVIDAMGTVARQGDEAQDPRVAIVTRIDPGHAFLINRNKGGSMMLAGETLFVLETEPAAYAILASNAAEKAATIKIVDYRMIGATGRLYLSGTESEVRAAATAAEQALEL
jgi:ethanolamine utilization microcompartment shell protein EutL